MAKIIKHHQVDVTGRFQLQNAGQSNGSVKSGTIEADAGDGSQVRLLEEHEQTSILEVTCSCGHVILIRCEHQ